MKKLLIIILLCGLYFPTRALLYSEPLIGEEGIFAKLFVDLPDGPFYSMSSRIDGKDTHGYISHPAPNYELVKLVGLVAQPAVEYPIYLDDDVITGRLRFFFSLFQFSLWLTLMMIILRCKSINRFWAVALLLTVSISPIALKTSANLQIDNTSGLFFVGFISIVLLIISKDFLKQKTIMPLLLLGSFIAGLGKQEWSVAFGMALFFWFIYLIILKRRTDQNIQTYLNMLFCMVIGMIAGNVSSFLYDSENWLKAIDAAIWFSSVSKGPSSNPEISRWVWVTVKRLPYISAHFALMAVIVLSFVRQRKFSPWSILLILYGIGLWGGYFVSSWNANPRYFAPSLAVLTIACVAVLPDKFVRWQKICMYALIAMMMFSTIAYLAFRKPNSSIYHDKIAEGKFNVPDGCIVWIETGIAWNKPELDYINGSNDFEKSKIRALENYNLKLIKAETMLLDSD